MTQNQADSTHKVSIAPGNHVEMTMTAGETLVIGSSNADIQGMSMDKSGALLIQLTDGASLLIKNFAEIATAAGNSFITLPSGQTVNLAELIQTLAPAATDENVADATPTAQVLDHIEPAAGKAEAPAHVVIIGKPHAHENLVVKLHEGEDYKFSFNMADPSSVKEQHGELVIAFKDGGEIIIPNYGTMKDAGLHDIAMKDGTALSVSDLGDTLAQAAQLNEVEPAAGGRGAGAHGGGFGFESVFSADLLHSIQAIGPIAPTELHYNTFDRKPLEFAPQDDKPVANDDTNNFNGEDHTTTGNVITGENGGPGAADVLGNDQPDRITEVSFGTTTVTVPETGTVTITGDHGTLTIGPDGSYTYTLNDDAHGDTTDQFVYTLTDHDGDSDTAILEIDSDGVPTIFNPNDPEESPGSRTVDETNLAPDTTVSGHLNADFYTDTPGTFGADDGSFSAGGSLKDGALTSNGHAVTVTLSGDTYTGTANGETVFTLHINEDGSYTFDLNGTLDHADGTDANDVIALNFGVAATDSDGDTATATLTINVRDDAPVAHDDHNSFNGEDSTTAGNVITGDHGGAGAADTLSHDEGNHVTQVTFGTTTVDVPATGTTTITGDHGTLTIAADGSYGYTLADGTHGDTADQFTYTLTDGDGDTSTANLLIDSDGIPTIFNPNDNPNEDPDARTVDETGLGTPAASFTGQLHADFYTDTPGTFGADSAGSFSSGGSRTDNALTSHGHEVTVTLSGNTYTGTANGETVFTLEIHSNGSYTFDLQGTLDHADGTDANDVITLNFGVAATDSDGDTANSTLTINVRDDAPVAHDDVNSFNGEDVTTTGNVITGDHGGPGAADTLSQDGGNHVTQVTFGSTTVDVPATGTTMIAGDHGTLTIAADGSYSYTLADGTHGDTADQFTYSLIDSDGDVSSAHLSIGSDGTPTIFNPNDPQESPGDRLVDETFLGTPAASTTGHLNANFFSDTPGTFGADGAGTFSSGGSRTGDALTSHGNPVTVTLSGDTYTGTANGETVFTLKINSDGSYTFDLQGTLDHKDGTDPNDDITLNFGVAATDSDGDTATATLTITVRDDAPVAHNDVNSFNGEDHTTTGNVITGDHGGPNAADTLSQDGGNHVTQVTFGATTVDVPATGTTTITGDHGTLTIAADGSYSYTLADGTHGDTADQFTYTLKDSDGDTSTAHLSIDSDGVPVIFNPNDPQESPGTRTVDETDLPAGTASVNGLLHANFFTDTPGTFGADASGPFSADGSVAGTGLTSNGHPVTVTLVGNTYTGIADGHTVFTLTIGSNGAYTFQLDGTLDHRNGADPDDVINLNFGVAATDSDGDTATATLTIKVLDDAPLAHDDVNFFNGEDHTTAGNVITGDHGGPGAADALSADTPNHVSQVTFGATTVDVPASGTVSIAGDHGTLTIAADGSYSYTLADGTHGDTADQFSYTLKDGDGDTSTAHLSIGSDGVPVIFNPNDPEASPGTRTVDETNLDPTTGVSGHLHANFFTDTPGSFSATGAATFTAGGSLAGGALTSDGHPVTVTMSGNTYTGTADGHTVFTLQVNADGSYTFQLDGTLDHADGANPNDIINLNFGVTATDSDGDSASATLTIRVLDDAPLAHDDNNTFAFDDGHTSGNVITGDHGGPGAADALSHDTPNHVTQISFGSTTVDVPTTGTATIHGDHGTLTIAADGSYTYTLDPGANNTGDVNTPHTFTGPAFPTDLHEGTHISAGDNANLGELHSNMVINANTQVSGSVTFDGAGYTNSLGAFTIAADGTLQAAQMITPSINGAGASFNFAASAGSQELGFFLLADGFNTNASYAGLDFAHGQLNFVYDFGQGDQRAANVTDSGNHVSLVFTDADGHDHVLNGPIYYTTDAGGSNSLNPDGLVHTLSGVGADSHTLTIAFEDLPNGGDFDYNDVIFNVQMTDSACAPDMADNFTYTLTDGDGDTSKANLNFDVPHDDHPEITTPGEKSVDETALHSGNVIVSDKVIADFFCDAPGTITPTGASSFSADGSLTGGALTSGGHAVTVTQSGDTYTGTADGHTVFTLEIHPDGNYTFTLSGTLDHADGSNPSDVINLHFGVTATDADGDTASSAITVHVLDDAPVAHDDHNSFDTSVGYADGNVVTGANGGAGAADTLSMDVLDKVTQVSFGSTVVNVPSSGTTTINGDHGTLTIAADGSYNYVLNPGANNATTTMKPVIMTDSALGVTVEVDGIQTDAGVQFTVKILAGVADLNGLFLDIGGNGGPILSLGPGNNMDSTNGFDYAVQLGTVGGNDAAVTQTTVTINGLHLADLDNGLVGIRATSAGTNQAGSLKLVGSIDTTTVPADTTDTFHYKLTDSDGDSSSALLTLSGAAPKLIVGTDVGDITGSTTVYATGNGSGQINGGGAGDILVGDVGGATMVNGVKNYNVELILDVSGSMGSLSDHTSKYYLLVQAVNNLLTSLHDYHGGSVTVNITPFDTTAHTGGTFAVTSDAGYANALNFLQHMGGGGTTNYESALQAAIGWLNGSGPTHGADTYTYFISDGEPNHYVTSSNSAATGTEAESMAQIQGSDGTNEIAQIQALSTEVIGVGINVGTKIANIDLIDSSHHATNVHDAHDLSQVLAAASPLNHIAGVGNDHIGGGDGNDIIFGDAMFTDVLASSHGVSMPAGSGWSVFEALEASAGWTRADTISYIHGHLTELATESLGSGGEVRTGGNDVLTGDGGSDVIFGQEGNDTISGGDGSDSLWGGSGADTFVFHSTESGVDHIKDFSTAQGDKIDISDVVASFDPLTDSLHNFVNVVVSGADSIVQVDPTGTGHAFHTVAVLEGVHTDADTLFAAGNLIA